MEKQAFYNLYPDKPLQTTILGYYKASRLSTSERNTLLINTDYPWLQGYDPAPSTEDEKNKLIGIHYEHEDLSRDAEWENTLTAYLAEGDRVCNEIISKVQAVGKVPT